MRYVTRQSGVLLACLAVACAVAARPAQAVDWSGVPAKEVVLFYPGQASWEWSLTQSDHSGNEKFREGKKCRECHRGEETNIGDLIVSGKKVEPDPIPGKAGSVALSVQAAHDGERLYLRLQWPATEPLSIPKMDPDFEAKVTVMIDDGSVVEAVRAGCWGSCHDDAVGMASAPEGKKITKYLAASRTKITRQGGGENYKPAGELEKLIDQGIFLEYWQARLNRGAGATAVSGYILDKRHKNEPPVIDAEGGLEGGKWTVVLSRKLTLGQGPHKTIAAGKTYTVGFAIHDSYLEHRFHDVSLGYTLMLGEGEADIIAVQR